jgi:hypothetical protein
VPVVVYGCENWLLNLREERGLRVVDSTGVLRRMFEPKKEKLQGTAEDYITRSFMICTHPILFTLG